MQNDSASNKALGAPQRSGDATMSAVEVKNVNAGACTQGYCITQTVTVDGTIQTLPMLEVTLSTVNGAIKITGGAEGEWKMVAKTEVRADSKERAEAVLRDTPFTWGHQTGESHFLDAKAEFKGSYQSVHRAVDISVVMPRSLVLRAVADTTNGGIDVTGVRTDGLSLQTTNGRLQVDASVTQVDMGATNGEISATLRPTASGRISVGTTNGGVDVVLPEDAQHGYDLDASTTNGEVDIRLRDGEVGPCPAGSQYYTPPCNHRTFKTAGYDQRAIQSQVQLGTTNGGVKAAPA